jgi:nucleoside-diphosphate-sugar epimerase
VTKHALVTGSAGLIGRHMSRYLRNHGWHVCAIDTRPHPGNSVTCDARQFFILDDRRFDLAMHCAAHVGGRLDIENRAAFIGAYNIQLDGAMFEWALRTRPAHVVYWSSSAAYPTFLQIGSNGYQLAETDINLDNPYGPADQTYGWAKLVGERLAKEAQAEGLKVHVFRPFSGYAPDQDTSYPFGAYVDRARRNADPFTVWGDGEQVRDFIHITDIIATTMAAIDADYPDPLNLCTCVPTSFNTLASMVTSAAGYSPTIEHNRTKPVGVRYRVGDPTEMHKIWVPQVTLEDAIRSALAE